MKKSCIAVFILMLMFFCSCQGREEGDTTTESYVATQKQEDELVIKQNKELFMSNFGFHEIIAQDIADVLGLVGVQTIRELKPEQKGPWGYVIRIKDNVKNIFYITLDEHGYLGTVRKDCLQGEILYYLKD